MISLRSHTGDGLGNFTPHIQSLFVTQNVRYPLNVTVG
jgi:hypothetical protein